MTIRHGEAWDVLAWQAGRGYARRADVRLGMEWQAWRVLAGQGPAGLVRARLVTARQAWQGVDGPGTSRQGLAGEAGSGAACRRPARHGRNGEN